MPEAEVDLELAPGTYQWAELRRHAESVLVAAGVEAPVAEARWIVERAAGGHDVWGDASEAAPARAVGHVVDMLGQRVSGRPLQYVLGRWAFRRLELVVDHRALIPRVETEVVADVALDEAVALGARSPGAGAGGGEFLVADLGTGSGVLALALVDELAEIHVWASDVSADALAVARANLAAVGLAAARVRLVEGSWFDALPPEVEGRFRVIVSNPPYVSEAEFDELPPEVRDFEPREALVAGPTGMEALEHIIATAPRWLTPDGSLVLELAPHQMDAACQCAESAGFTRITARYDLTGRPRVLVATRRDEGSRAHE